MYITDVLLSPDMNASFRLSPEVQMTELFGARVTTGGKGPLLTQDTDMSPGDITQTHREARGDLSAGYSLFKTQLYYIDYGKVKYILSFKSLNLYQAIFLAYLLA